MGLGQFGGGVGVTQFLVAQGAAVLVTDTQPAEKLNDSLKALHSLSVQLRLGEHRVEDFTGADLVVVNPAVRPDNIYVRAAVDAGVPITTEMTLLVERLPDRRRVVGITGTAGKSTTTAMLGHILREQLGEAAVHVGGNLGGSLLPTVDRIAAEHVVVLELSSFMLHHLAAVAWSPGVAAVTNCSPNHLDWHGSMDAYAAAKRAIMANQQPGDVAVLGVPVSDWPVPAGVQRRIVEPLASPLPLCIPGSHNQHNAAMALAIAQALDMESDAALQSLGTFAGLPHRLQLVCEARGVRYFNDSKSTTPDAALLAMRAFPDDVTLHIILGGYDKGSELAPLARDAAGRCATVCAIGQTAEAIRDAAGQSEKVAMCDDVAAAVEHCVSRSKRGDVVLLSPGCASWDQFTNFEHRGAAFVEAVLRCTTERTG